MKKSAPASPEPWREAATTHLVVQLVHDLRNHLNSLVLEVTDLGEQAAEQGMELETDRLMNGVREAVEQLQMVRDRLEVGPLRPAPLELAPWVEELRQQVLEEPAYEGLVDWPKTDLPTGAAAEWEAELVGAALGELLDNAADAIELSANGAASRPRRMRVTAALEGPAFVLRIVNPCPPDKLTPHLEHLGEARGLTDRRSKLGLGCAFAREVAEAHGGTCSYAYDEGEREFIATLSLPVG
ncbi:MAG: hypothetical protein AAGK14_11270 [Verrucomicrobiota bacterium]